MENIIKSLGAKLVAFYKRFVTKAKFVGNLRAAGIIAKEDNFDIRMQQLPAFKRVALNNAAVPFKGLAVVNKVSMQSVYYRAEACFCRTCSVATSSSSMPSSLWVSCQLG